MGVDAMIYFKATEPFEFENELPSGYSVAAAGHYGPDEATHRVWTYSRYYGPHYERGDWGNLCKVLMLLHACKAVGKVWYGGDTTDGVPECKPEDVLKICAHFMANGNRPYRSYFK
jgi:hypothetical protein